LSSLSSCLTRHWKKCARWWLGRALGVTRSPRDD
jgi:hypothetical protein